MRTASDLCLLCQSRFATKTQSHIIPKFITKSVFGTGNQKRGFRLNTSTAEKPAKIVQDSAKEDYILCPECEQYFSLLENYMSGRLRDLWNQAKASDFRLEQNGGGVQRKVCLNIHSGIARLFIYSIVWRCSISSTEAHIDFKLETDEENSLRKVLLYFFASDQSTLIQKLTDDPDTLICYPYIIFTSQFFQDKTGNVISTVPFAKNPYLLHLNEFVLLITFINSKKLESFEFLLNNSLDKPIVGFFPENTWQSIKQDFAKRYAQITKEASEKRGVKPYIDPNRQTNK